MYRLNKLQVVHLNRPIMGYIYQSISAVGAQVIDILSDFCQGRYAYKTGAAKAQKAKEANLEHLSTYILDKEP